MIAQRRTRAAVLLAAVLLALGAGAAAPPAEAGFYGEVDGGMAGRVRRLAFAWDAASLFTAVAHALPSGQVGEDPPGPGLPDG